MIIIPAIDLINGEAVRLEQGAFDKKTKYFSNPLEAGKMFEDAGLTHLHLVDLDGAKEGETKNLKALENISKGCNLKIDFSGGISNEQRVNDAFNAGADVVSIGSMAIKNADLFERILLKYGGDKIWLGADVRDKKIATRGWTEQSETELIPYLNHQVGLKYTYVTDISKDGMLSGINEELYTEILNTVPEINLIASGGVADMKGVEACKALGVYGVIVGKAIYEGRITMEELKKFKG